MPWNPDETISDYFKDNAAAKRLLSPKAAALTRGDLARLHGFGKQNEPLPGAMPNLQALTMDDLNSLGLAFEESMPGWKYRKENAFACCTCCT